MINPSLKNLEMLVGDWKMELSNASFIPNPTEKIIGKVSFRWIENGAYMLMRMGDDNALWLISRDESTLDYQMFYFDDRKVSRIYHMSFSKKTWKIWRNSQGFSQRFEGKISKDGKTINAYWEKSLDGKKWQHDFDVVYKRK